MKIATIAWSSLRLQMNNVIESHQAKSAKCRWSAQQDEAENKER
jgi:hypothetical protein